MIRAFIAVDLPDLLREEIASLESELKRSGADVKWIEPAHLHLTLKFLGNIADDQVSSLKEALSASLEGCRPFTFQLEGIGAFPKITSPWVVWVGVSEGKEKLIDLTQKVEAACSKLGVPPEERPFSPHLTIGRVRSNEGLPQLIKRLPAAEFRGSTPADVNHLILFQSTLSPQGPIYTPLVEIPLV